MRWPAGALTLLLFASCARCDSSFSVRCEVGEWVRWARCYDYLPNPIGDAKIGLQEVSVAADVFRSVHGRYPTRAEGVSVLVREGFLRPAAAEDPWGRPYVYEWPGKAHPDSYDVMTYGADGKPGGIAEDEDRVAY